MHVLQKLLLIEHEILCKKNMSVLHKKKILVIFKDKEKKLYLKFKHFLENAKNAN